MIVVTLSQVHPVLPAAIVIRQCVTLLEQLATLQSSKLSRLETTLSKKSSVMALLQKV